MGRHGGTTTGASRWWFAGLVVLLTANLVHAQAGNPTGESAQQPSERAPAPGEADEAKRPLADDAPVDLTGEGQLGPPQPQQPGAAVVPPYYNSPPGAPPPRPGEEEDDDDLEVVEEAHGGTQRNFGFGPRIAGLWAFGLGLRAGHRYFGADVSGGWLPLWPTLNPDTDEETVELLHSWQLSLMAYVAFNPDSTFVAGVTAGYIYNSVLRRGLALAFDGVVNFSNHLGLHFHAGPAFYPDAADRMLESGDVPPGTDLGEPGPGFQLGIGAGLIIYP